MRDKLIHGYFGVDLGTVRDTATNDVVLLKEKLTKILKKGRKRLNNILSFSNLYGYTGLLKLDSEKVFNSKFALSS